MYIDHIVLWVDDAKRSLDFYSNVLGLDSLRADEFFAGNAKFPSVKLSERSILDLMERETLLPLVQRFTDSEDNIGGTPINHVCISMSETEYLGISEKLNEQGIEISPGGKNAFGAQGSAAESAYFSDPDGNIIEIRYYDN
ncbi:MAG: VOC family protein [Pseudomonadota bacterium]